MKRPIAISLSPNAQKDDVLLALKLLLKPVNWYDFSKTEVLENKFAEYFGKGYKALAVNGGRSALFLILKSLGITYGDEVIVQSLTCVAVTNSVKWTGADNVFVDVGNDFNIDPMDLADKIGNKTRAVIIQNSFGIPARYDTIIKIVRNKNKKILIIEDCALSLGAKYNNRKVGTLGDISFFSFGRDKVISSVFGGMILCKDNTKYEKIKSERDKLGYPGPGWLVQQLLHPLIFSFAVPLYNFGFGKFSLGKAIIYAFQKLKFLSRAVYKEEELSQRPKVFPAKMPGALSVMAINQFNKLDKFNKHRRKIARFYFKNIKNSGVTLPPKNKGAIWVRFPLINEKAPSIIKTSKAKGILLGDWYKDVVVPVRNPDLVGYKYGSCPNAESIKGKILNLPTYHKISISEAERVIELIK